MAANLDGVNGQLAGAVQAMINASGGQIWVNSGFRDHALQARLYAEAVQKHGQAQAGNWVAPPGHSNHERGLAVDLGGNMSLAHQLAARFGLTFPMSWEPWHIELPSTRGGASPAAYTPSPFGDPNPTTDQSISQHPDHVTATGVEAMRAMNPLGTPGVEALGTPGLGTTQGGGPTNAGVAAQGGAQGGQAGGGTTPGGATNPQSGGSVVSPADLFAKLRAKGLSPQLAAAGVAIASRESGFNAAQTNNNPGTGDYSSGLFQINQIGGMHSQFSTASLRTVDGSVDAFAQMAGGGDLSPWGGYKGVPWYHGVSQGNLAQAAALAGMSVQQLQGVG